MIVIEGESFPDPFPNREVVTAPEIAARLDLTSAAIRYHCRAGVLRDVAYKIGETWVVPVRAARRFVLFYTPQSGGRLRETEKRAGDDRQTPPARRSAPTRQRSGNPAPTSQRKAHEG